MYFEDGIHCRRRRLDAILEVMEEKGGWMLSLKLDVGGKNG